MQSLALFSEFDKESYEVNHSVYVPENPRFADTQKWEEHGIEFKNLLTQNMLAKEIATDTTRLSDRTVRMVSVNLCYNWKHKTEFILVKITEAETFSYYTPQYGRDDNYNNHTRS